MAKLDGLAKAFDEGAEKAAASDNTSMLKRSMIIISTVEKLQRQGIKITKKAKMDFMLACRQVARASALAGKDLMEEYREIHEQAEDPTMKKVLQTPGETIRETDRLAEKTENEARQEAQTKVNKKSMEQPAPKSTKRTPQEHPEEFRKALEYSRKLVAHVNALQDNNERIPIKQMEEYQMCKKFLAKYT